MSAGNWQRRWHPLLEQWVLISARSAMRPWSGARVGNTSEPAARHDPDCYLCPGVVRANGIQNPQYQGAYAFDNDFPALSFAAPAGDSADQPLWRRSAAAHGHCRVLCWSERHDATLANLSEPEMKTAAHLWKEEYTTLSADPAIAQVLIFENKGKEIGVSNLHPHGQVYATAFLTDTASRMRTAQQQFAASQGGQSLLQCLVNDNHTQQHLLIEQSEHFSVIVPYAARFAYETWIIPNEPVPSLQEMSAACVDDLAMIYQRQVRRYDILFQRSAPNISLFHNAPCDDDDSNRHWCFHLAFQPPLREPEKMKYLAGFESGANNIVNPVQPESAAAQLRSIDLSGWSA